jgi:transposase
MDNLAVHHYDGGYILEEYLEEMGVELIFTPTYSPDLNPVEMCFAKVKAKLNGELSDAVHENLKLAVMDAIETITSSDMAGYYRATSYMFPDLE